MSEQGTPLAEQEDYERLIVERAETAQGIFQLQQSLGESVEYLIKRIKELEERIAALEEGMERLGPIIGHRKRGER